MCSNACFLDVYRGNDIRRFLIAAGASYYETVVSFDHVARPRQVSADREGRTGKGLKDDQWIGVQFRQVNQEISGANTIEQIGNQHLFVQGYLVFKAARPYLLLQSIQRFLVSGPDDLR